MGCKEKEEIMEWLRDKYILVLSNQMIFDAESYEDGSKILQESVLTWYKVNTQVRESMINSVQITKVYLQDEFVQNGESTLDVREIFRPIRQPSRSYEWDDNVLAEVKFEMDYDVMSIYRNVYNILAVLSDAGGLSTSVMAFLALVVYYLNYRKEQYEFGIVLFSKKELRDRCVTDGDIDPEDKKMMDTDTPIHLNPFQLIKLNLLRGKKRQVFCLRANYEDILL